jgi:hypothetical protein
MAVPKVTSLKCPSCSAPIQVPPNVSDIQCYYCRAPVHIERTKPPAHAPQFVIPNTVYIDPNVGKNVGAALAASVLPPLVLTLVIGGVSAFAALRGSSGSSGFGASGPRKVTSFPATCASNEELLVTGQTFAGKGTLIEAGLNCKLTIKDSTLKGDVVVEAKGNAQLTITNSKLEGQEEALLLANNAKVKIADKSEIVGAGTGIEGKMNIDLTVDDSKIRGGTSAIHSGNGLTLRATGAEIAAKRHALDLDLNADLNLRQTTVKAEEEAILATYNLKLDMDGSTVEGSTGLKSGVNPKLKVTKKSRLAGSDAAIDVESNLELTVDDSLVESKDVAVRAATNTKVNVVKQGKIKGGNAGISAGINTEIRMNEGTIESGGNAIEAKFNTEIDARRSTISGGKNAFAFERKPSALRLTETKVTGAQNFSLKR